MPLAWQSLGDKVYQMSLVDQYLLAACMEFHSANSSSAFNSVQIRDLFDSLIQTYNPESEIRAGFTHLIAYAKKSQIIATRLEDRINIHAQRTWFCINPL
jgi:hypothetical protein